MTQRRPDLSSPPVVDHVALVTRSLERALGRLEGLGLATGPVERFPSEGTREVYVGAEHERARLLLLEPLGEDGPYTRAMARRGPGLHHVALAVPDLDAFLASLRGWLLHPRSVFTRERSRTAWLARPGCGALIEVQERAEPAPGRDQGLGLVSRLEVPLAASAPPDLLEGLDAVGSALAPTAGAARLELQVGEPPARWFEVAALVGA